MEKEKGIVIDTKEEYSLPSNHQLCCRGSVIIPQNNTLIEKCDVYSFGVVLLEAICKDKLTNVENKQKHPVEENIDPNLKGKIAPECWEVVMDITERCLKFDPNERPIMGEVEVQLEIALPL
ncbi:hypothetical protein JHK85_022842 [Glycine max]|nr:hypothetical protein JHK85_022842 [Glycine max]KAG5026460.1 hypothetical protein JHK86_022374 [Glycine max]